MATLMGQAIAVGIKKKKKDKEKLVGKATAIGVPVEGRAVEQKIMAPQAQVVNFGGGGDTSQNLADRATLRDYRKHKQQRDLSPTTQSARAVRPRKTLLGG